jgi:CBS domain-containing protein
MPFSAENADAGAEVATYTVSVAGVHLGMEHERTAALKRAGTGFSLAGGLPTFADALSDNEDDDNIHDLEASRAPLMQHWAGRQSLPTGSPASSPLLPNDDSQPLRLRLPSIQAFTPLIEPEGTGVHSNPLGPPSLGHASIATGFTGPSRRPARASTAVANGIQYVADADILELVYTDEPVLRYPDFAEHYPRFPVVDETMHVTEAERQMYVDLRPYQNPTPTTIHVHAPLVSVFLLFRNMSLRHLIVINDCHDVVGIITRRELVTSHIQECVKQKQERRSGLVEMLHNVGTPAARPKPSWEGSLQ